MSKSRHRRDDDEFDFADSDDDFEPQRGWFRRFVRKTWKPVLGAGVIGIIAVGVLIGVAYAKTPIPGAQAIAKRQATLYTYRDGTPMFQAGMNRQSVKLDQVPKTLQHAVLAAEDREFYNEPGVSFRGMMRAVYSTITGKQVQGGSTITQEFARNYYDTLSQERSVSRKFKEVMVATKLNNKYPKDWVLTQYLNTILYGRNAFGIQAASKAYFGKDVSKLDTGQSAYLAAIIQSPESLPKNPGAMKYRWNYVLDGMVKKGWLTPDARTKVRFPHVISEKKNEAGLTGQKGYLYFEAKRELIQELQQRGLGGADRLAHGGLKVQTTFSKKDVAEMASAVRKTIRPMRKTGVEAGMASVDPSTGEVIASYGGPGYQYNQFDHAFQSTAQAGSSFKPYVLATALKQNIGLKTLVDGSSPRRFPGLAAPVHNDEGDGKMGAINLVKATAQSVNTAYVQLAVEADPQNVVKTAEDTGIPKSSFPSGLQIGPNIALGTAAVRPVDQAGAYATFANRGQHITPHVIRKVTTFDNSPLIDNTKDIKPTEAFSSGVADDATFAMQHVVTEGTARSALLGFGRPVAGKTGTTDQNKAAWFSGYTPQMSTAVGLWRTSKDGKKALSLRNLPGYSQVYGGTIPAKIWRDYMTQAMEGKEVKSFPPPQYVGDTKLFATPPPRPTHTARPTQTPTAHPTRTRTSMPHSPPPTLPTGGPTGPTMGPTPSDRPTGNCGPMNPICNNGGQGRGNGKD
ncbi:MAG TPA: transglycosylase domain-containing protein [Streptosporangiaceae bacterium]